MKAKHALLARTPLILIRVILLGAFLSVAMAAPAQAPTEPPACGAPEYRQFDFWIGHWDVYEKSAPLKKVAQSRIEKLYAGCAIRENWMPLGGEGSGGSLNAYQPGDGLWHQIWTDSEGVWVKFAGRWNGQAMVIEGLGPVPGHPNRRRRLTYTILPGHAPDRGVEQRGDVSDDEGKTWQPEYDLIYQPAREERPAGEEKGHS
jgi:hypothetical protein